MPDPNCDALEAGCLPVAETERLSPEQGRREAIVFGLRLTEGIDLGVTEVTTDGTWG